jgi:hypothetical protein
MASLILPRDELSDLRGSQQPRILHLPKSVSSTGQEAVELAAMAELEMDPWQQFVLQNSLGERPDGKWSAFEVGLEVPRQNGKGGILEARELAGLFLLGERLIIHSAHEFATASEALERMDNILEGAPDLSRRVRVIKRSHGEEGVYLKNGQRLRYKTRTKGGGRGFSADCVILDEAMILAESFIGSLFFTLSARPNPQVWYTGSAVDQSYMDHGRVFARIRQRALQGEDPALAYFGWSPAFERPDDLPPTAAADPDVWAQANPALGIRIDPEHIAKEHRSMDARTFAVERLGVGDWPATDEGADTIIDMDVWRALEDEGSQIDGSVCFAYDVKPDRSMAAIAVAGLRADGLAHGEIVEHRRGTGWVAQRLSELTSRHDSLGVVCAGDDAKALIPEIRALDMKVDESTAAEQAQAHAQFINAVNDATLRHLGTPELEAALRGAATTQREGGQAWSRKNSSVDICPLVALTHALSLAKQRCSLGEPLAAWG